VLSLIGLVSWLIAPVANGDARAARRNPAVVVDGWWSGDYAQKACEQAKSFPDQETESRIRNSGCGAIPGCPEMMARSAACTAASDPKAQASRFEDRLMREFAAAPTCKGAAFARYRGPDAQSSAVDEAIMRKPHWEFSVDFVAGAWAQSWSLQYLGEEEVRRGTSATEARMASDVCAILFGQGAPPR
jgi:hypothetical protein